MPRPKKTREQLNEQEILKRRLNELGEMIYVDAQNRTRVATERLKKSLNYAVKPYSRITFFQESYGKFVRMKGVNAGGDESYDALRISIKKNLPLGIEAIKKDLTASILYPFGYKKLAKEIEKK